jgi:hypothetical protein
MPHAGLQRELRTHKSATPNVCQCDAYATYHSKFAMLCLSHGVYKLVAAFRTAGGVLVSVMHLLKWSHGTMHGHGQGEEEGGLHLNAGFSTSDAQGS